MTEKITKEDFLEQLARSNGANFTDTITLVNNLAQKYIPPDKNILYVTMVGSLSAHILCECLVMSILRSKSDADKVTLQEVVEILKPAEEHIRNLFMQGLDKELEGEENETN